MKLSYSFFLNLYYRFWDSFLPQKSLSTPNEFLKKRVLFLYFDYEREFSGNDLCITDQQLEQILALLNKYNFKATWFTVGKVIEKYPGSIESIVENGHELGSHTYDHISPFFTSNNVILDDFAAFEKMIEGKYRIYGFHSPKGEWSVSLLKKLIRFNYIYDVATTKRPDRYKISLIRLNNKYSFYRLRTLGDDWPLFQSGNDASHAEKYFKNLLKKLKPGDVAGLGFHPWILHSSSEIFEGFEMLMDYIASQKDFHISPAIEIVRYLSGSREMTI